MSGSGMGLEKSFSRRVGLGWCKHPNAPNCANFFAVLDAAQRHSSVANRNIEAVACSSSRREANPHPSADRDGGHASEIRLRQFPPLGSPTSANTRTTTTLLRSSTPLCRRTAMSTTFGLATAKKNRPLKAAGFDARAVVAKPQWSSSSSNSA
jgi:hypothetical protein